MILTDNWFILNYKNSPESIKKYLKPLPDMKKIALCGSSGCGKTTLAKALSPIVGIPYTPMSQKGIFSSETIEKFREQTNNNYFTEISHQMIIYLSHRFPNFGINFQFELLKERTLRILENETFITDRSPVDNLVYFLLQCGPYASNQQVNAFIRKAQKSIENVDAIILLHQNPEKGYVIEDDGSRIINNEYQKMVDSVFEYVIKNHFKVYPQSNSKPYIMEIKEWDITKRIEILKGYILNS